MSKQSAYFLVDDMTCSHCEKVIKKGLDEIKGVLSVSVNLDTKKVAVDFDDEGSNMEAIRDKFDELGYDASLIQE